MQRNKGTTEWERLEISSRRLEIPREHLMQIWAQKGQKQHGLNRSRRYEKELVRIHRRTIQKKTFMTQISMMV